MLDGLPLDILGNFTGWSLSALLFLLMATGRLVPISTLRREQKLLEREAEAWRQAHDTESKQLDRIVEQLQRVVPPQPTGGPPADTAGQAVR